MKFFSFRLYKEAMRQSRAVGILTVVIATLISAFRPVITLFQNRNYDTAFVNFIDIERLVSGLGIVSVFLPIILAVKIFGFLFKRSSSDFYHALPYTRQCLYVTNLVAILSWCAMALVLMVTIPCIAYGIDPHSSYEISFAFYNLLVGLVIMLMTSGAVMIAVSITGKPLLAMEIAAFIVFLPRVLILIALASVKEMTLMIDINQVPILSMNYSLPLMMMIGSAMSYPLYVAAFSFMPGIIYTLILAIIYLVLGGVLFCKRRSETAENAAPNRKVQVILRIVYSIGFFFAATSVYMIYGLDESVVMLIVIGILVYLGYELTTTKKFKKMLKSIPALAIVAILCFIYGGIIKVASDNVLNDVPTAGEIESIQMAGTVSGYWYENPTYNDLLIGELAFEDKEVTSIIAKAYGDTAEKVKNGERIDYDYDLVTETYRINYSNGKSHVRVLYMTYDEFTKLQTLFAENEEYQEAMLDIPDEAYVTEFFNEEYNKAVWKQFKEEYEKLSDKDKLQVLNQYDYMAEGEEIYDEDYYYEDEEYLRVSGYIGTQPYSQEYILTESRTPETIKLIYEYRYIEERENMMKIINSIDDMESGEINIWAGEMIEVGEYVAGTIDLYVYYDDGKITSGSINGDWTHVDGTKMESDKKPDEELATDGDADYEDGYYEDDFYYESSWYSCELDAQEAKKLLDMMLNSYNFDEQKTSILTPSNELWATSWKQDGLSSKYSSANMDTVIDELKMEEFIKYLVENYSK